MNFTAKINKGDLIESVYEGGGFGLITRKEYIWVDEDTIDNFTGEGEFLYDLDIGDFAFDCKDDKYKVLQFDILYQNNLFTLYHFQLGMDWYV
jgi:hypothetical protein